MARCSVRAKLRYLCVVLVGAICWGCVKPEEVGSEGYASFFNDVAGISPSCRSSSLSTTAFPIGARERVSRRRKNALLPQHYEDDRCPCREFDETDVV